MLEILVLLVLAMVAQSARADKASLFEYGERGSYFGNTREDVPIPKSTAGQASTNSGFDTFHREEGVVQLFFPRGAPESVRTKFPLVYLCTPIHGFTFRRWTEIMQPSLINFLTSHGFAVVAPSSIGERDSPDEVLGAIMPDRDSQSNGVSLEEVAKRYVNFTVASFSYLTNDFFGIETSKKNNDEYVPGETILDTARRNYRTRMYTLYSRVDVENTAMIGFSVGGAVAAYSGSILKSRNQMNLKMSFLLAPTIGERPGAARKVGLELWNRYHSGLQNNPNVIVAGSEDGMGGLSSSRAFYYEAEKLEALLVEIRFATHCHFPVLMSECNFLNVQEDIGGIRAFDLALANAAFQHYLRGDQKAGELISLQNGLDAFKSPTSTWEVDAITYRNDVRGLIKLFNDNRGRTFQQSAKVKFREMENSK
jgi:hypothetical protein